MAEQVGSIFYDLDLQDDKFNAGADRAGSRLQGLGGAFQTVDDLSQQLMRTMVIAGTVIATAIAGMAFQAVTAAAKFETMGIQLKTVFQGNTQAAQEAEDMLIKFSEKTPFQLEEILQSYIKLKNFGLNPTKDSLTAFGNTAASMGRSLQEMTDAVAMASVGNFRMLREFGILATEHGNKVKFTFQGVTTTVKKNAQSIQDYLIKLGNTKFSGGMEAQSQTLTGLMTTLHDVVDITMSDIANKSGLFDFIKEKVRDIIAVVQDKKDLLIGFFHDLGGTIKTIFQILTGSDSGSMKDFSDSMGKLFNEHLIDLMIQVRGYFVAIGDWIKTHQALVNSFFRNFGEVALIAVGALLAFGVASTIATSPLTPLLLIILGISAAMTAWDQNIGGVRTTIMDLYTKIATFLTPYLDKLHKLFVDQIIPALLIVWGVIHDNILPALDDLWQTISTQLLPALKGFWDLISPVLIPVLKALAVILGVVIYGVILTIVGAIWVVIKVLTTLVQTAADVVNGVSDYIKGLGKLFMNLPDIISKALSTVGEAIMGPFRDAFKWLFGQLDEAKKNLDKLNPFHRESPSLVDWVEKGTNTMVETYGSMFNRLNAMSTQNRAGMVGATQASTGAIMNASQPIGGGQHITIQLNPSGIIARSPGEMRDVVRDLMVLMNQTIEAQGGQPIQPKIIR